MELLAAFTVQCVLRHKLKNPLSVLTWVLQMADVPCDLLTSMLAMIFSVYLLHAADLLANTNY